MVYANPTKSPFEGDWHWDSDDANDTFSLTRTTLPLMAADTDFDLSLVKDKSIQHTVKKKVKQYYGSFPDVFPFIDTTQTVRLSARQYDYLLVPVDIKEDSLNSTEKSPSIRLGCYLHILTPDYKSIGRYLVKKDDIGSDAYDIVDPGDEITGGQCIDVYSMFKCKTGGNTGIGITYGIRAGWDNYWSFGVFFDVLPDGTLQENKALTAKLSTSTEVAKDALTARKTLGCLR